ncbi:MAG: DUF6464 family protein [Crinalium sp.]
MFETILVFVVSLMPALFSLFLIHKAEMRARSNISSAMSATAMSRLRCNPPQLEEQYVEGVGFLIGDISCQYNARSAYIRCAINPQGPCKECRYYEMRESA